MVLDWQQARAVRHQRMELLLSLAFRERCEENTLLLPVSKKQEKREYASCLVLLNLLLITCVTTKNSSFFPPRSKDTSMFMALWIHLISLKSFV